MKQAHEWPSPKPLYSASQIADALPALAASIQQTYTGLDLLVLPILKGAFIFASDLVRLLPIQLQIDFLHASSYGVGTTAGDLSVTLPDSIEIKDRHVLLVDDIADTANTLLQLSALIAAKHPASVRTCVCINKTGRRTHSFQPDFSLFELEEGFVVGYGMDHAEQYRHLPYIGLLESTS